MNFEGDVLLTQFDGDSFDIEFENGQPKMTKDLRTLVFLLAFGEDHAYNETVNNEDEKMKSEFPEVIARANVDDNTLSRGTNTLKKALSPLLKWSMASTIEIFGQIFATNRMGWQIEINKPDDKTSKYFIIWEEGIIKIGNS